MCSARDVAALESPPSVAARQDRWTPKYYFVFVEPSEEEAVDAEEAHALERLDAEEAEAASGDSPGSLGPMSQRLLAGGGRSLNSIFDNVTLPESLGGARRSGDGPGGGRGEALLEDS